MAYTFRDPKLAALAKNHRAGKKATRKNAKRKHSRKKVVRKKLVRKHPKHGLRSKKSVTHMKHGAHKDHKKSKKVGTGTHKAKGGHRSRKLRCPTLPPSHPFNRPRKRVKKASKK